MYKEPSYVKKTIVIYSGHAVNVFSFHYFQSTHSIILSLVYCYSHVVVIGPLFAKVLLSSPIPVPISFFNGLYLPFKYLFTSLPPSFLLLLPLFSLRPPHSCLSLSLSSISTYFPSFLPQLLPLYYLFFSGTSFLPPEFLIPFLPSPSKFKLLHFIYFLDLCAFILFTYMSSSPLFIPLFPWQSLLLLFLPFLLFLLLPSLHLDFQIFYKLVLCSFFIRFTFVINVIYDFIGVAILVLTLPFTYRILERVRNRRGLAILKSRPIHPHITCVSCIVPS